MTGVPGGLTFARERPEETVQILEREWRVDSATAKESYASVAKSFSKDGASSDAGLKVHVSQIQRADNSNATGGQSTSNPVLSMSARGIFCVVASSSFPVNATS